MAESSFESIDDEYEDVPTTSTPAQVSIYSLRRKRRVENYLSGSGRNASSINSNVLSTFSSNESGNSEEDCTIHESHPKKATKCTRGCSVVLANLTKSYRDAGRHCWPTLMYRQNNYPSPMKAIEVQNGQLYRNITGKGMLYTTKF